MSGACHLQGLYNIQGPEYYQQLTFVAGEEGRNKGGVACLEPSSYNS